jgi:hypothetical protein
LVRLFLCVWVLLSASLGVAALTHQQPEYAPPAGETAPPPPPPEPIFTPFWKKIDWSNPRNIAMVGLGVGSLVLVKIAFRKMTE